MDATRPVSYDMSHYFGMLRRHWWIIALFTAIGLAGALALVRTQPKVYEATTNVLVTPTSNQAANAAGGRTNGVINLDTEAQLVTSAEVAGDAAKLLKVTTPPSDLIADVSIDVPPNTTVLAITYSAGTPAAAQAGSHAFATAYLANRQASAQADLTSQLTAINAKVNQETAQLRKINDDLANLTPGSAKYGNEQSQRQTLISQINQLTNRANSLSTTTVSAGKIITDAALPTAATSPSVPLFLTSGAMVGVLLGLAAAFARQRVDKRVRFAADVPRRSGLPLIAQLPARVKPRFNDVFPPYGAGGRTFSRLRNEVLASLAEGEKVIVVTGASRGIASTVVAANLASALARAGSEVVLVSAHLPESMVEVAPTPQMLGVAPTPGLSDVLAGKVPLDTATQRAPRNPWLRVITTGGTASATGFLQSQTLRDILAQLRTQAEYVVIEAPSTANTADAQSLASLADASIVVVELRRTTHMEVLDAAEQLLRVSRTMLGCVVLPRIGRTNDETPPPPAADRMRATPVDAGPRATFVEAAPTSRMDMSAVSASARTRDGVDPLTTTSTRMRIIAARKEKRLRGERPSPETPEAAARAAGPDGIDTVVFDGARLRADTAPAGRPERVVRAGNARDDRHTGTDRNQRPTPPPAQPGGPAGHTGAPGQSGSAGHSGAPGQGGPAGHTGAPGHSGSAGHTGAPAPTAAAVPVRPLTLADAKPASVKPSDGKPTRTMATTMPATTKPSDAKPSDAMPVDTKPVEARSVETKPAETRRLETKPADTKPADTKAAESKPADTKPADTKAAETRPAGPTVVTKAGVLNVALPDVGRTNTPVNPTNITAPVVGARSIVINPANTEEPKVTVRATNGSTDNGLAMSSVAQTSGGSVKASAEPRVGGTDSTTLFKRIDLVYVEDGDGEGASR